MNSLVYSKLARISSTSPIKKGVTQRLLSPAGSKHFVYSRQHHAVAPTIHRLLKSFYRNHSLTVSCQNVSFSGCNSIKTFSTTTTMGKKQSRPQMDNTKKSDGQGSQATAQTDDFIEVVVAKTSDVPNGQ